METKVKAVVMSFDFDRILETIVLGSKREDVSTIADCLLVEKHVREWYCEQFESDPMGVKITDALSWYDLLEQMRKGRNIYSIIGVGDSIVRERIMGHLAKLLNVPYEVVYRLMLRDNFEVAYGEYDDGGCVRCENFVEFKRPSFSNATSMEFVLFNRLSLDECRDLKRLIDVRLRSKSRR